MAETATLTRSTIRASRHWVGLAAGARKTRCVACAASRRVERAWLTRNEGRPALAALCRAKSASTALAACSHAHILCGRVGRPNRALEALLPQRGSPHRQVEACGAGQGLLGAGRTIAARPARASAELVSVVGPWATYVASPACKEAAGPRLIGWRVHRSS
eukprot:7380226-Prymnesium_polylepis.2